MHTRNRVGIAALLVAFLFYLLTINHNTPPLIGVAYNSKSGQIGLQKDAGFYFTPPWVSVAYIDPRPVQACWSTNARIMNCKLLTFNIAGLSDFIRLQGMPPSDNSMQNQPCIFGSSNRRDGDGCSAMTRILAGYAFANQSVSFLTVEAGTFQQ